VHITGSETTPPYTPQSIRFGSEPPYVEDDVDVWRYTILELHARNDDDILYYFRITARQWLKIIMFIPNLIKGIRTSELHIRTAS